MTTRGKPSFSARLDSPQCALSGVLKGLSLASVLSQILKHVEERFTGKGLLRFTRLQ